jgi:hypothetical protein
MDGTDHDVTLSSTPQTIRDLYGAFKTVNGTSLTVSPEPVYIEFGS